MNKFQSIKNSTILKDSQCYIIGNALGKGATVLGGIIIARILGKDLFGEYGFLRNTLLIIAIFSTLGLGYTTTIFVSRLKNNNPNVLRYFIKISQIITICFSSFIAILVYIFAPEIALIFDDLGLTYGLKMLAVIIVFNAITTTQIGIMAGFKLFKIIAIVNIISGITTFILITLLTYIYKFNGALMALLISQFVNCILNQYALKKTLTTLPKTKERIKVSKIFRVTFPITLQEMSLSFTHWFTSILLLKLSSYGEVGIYSAATQWSTIILFIPIVLRNVTLSYLSSTNSTTDRHRKVFYTMVGIYFLCTFVPATIITLLGNYITKLYGQSFNGLDFVLLLTCYTAVINSIYNAFSSEFMSRNQNWFLYFLSLFRDFFIIIGLYAFIKYLNIEGAASLGLSSLVMNLIAVIVCLVVWIKQPYIEQHNAK